ncbi:hypothetical protein MCOR27_002086 [Pyricularia oryzae]|uniref:AA1-like domain-containing protein n=2 Tax=Pyricularia TaxID=48558 RepID=A0ABQ8NWY5_PYRGI|nr:hypothetical protein MCOR01_002132 [Pyricularia oryzae]KAI6303283.1 hypothetical protein MCOR33_001546 [Pyricularia grisea]KAH9429281.1 hypothetical protein MCOR02_010686 [Pyricularia oryzae]KAI6263724.1 hypothetical protein MCOR19_000057 [Pyricularia oryzae]KAI6285799.1 hypothetical protein MCOR27_002086 [Pyricularia oryzae]
MRCWSLLLLVTTATAIPASPPGRTLLARDWPANCVPGHDFTVSNFTLSIPKSDAANKTTITFGFSSKQTRIETTCRRSASTWPVYLVKSARERFACDNSSVEFIYDVAPGSGDKKGTLALMEAACTEGTKKWGWLPIETGGSVDMELQCEEDKTDAASNCKSKSDTVSGNYISYALRPHIEPDEPVPWTIGDEGGREDCRNAPADRCPDGGDDGGDDGSGSGK